MNRQKIVWIFIFVLMGGNAILGASYFFTVRTLHRTQAILETQKTNSKVLAFTKLFLEKVLKAQAGVSFEERLRLENAARDIGDAQILAQWQKFTASTTEMSAQEEVKNLLVLLAGKIEVQ